MKTLKRLLWLPIVILLVTGWIISTIPLIIILGGNAFDKKIGIPVMDFCYKKMK